MDTLEACGYWPVTKGRFQYRTWKGRIYRREKGEFYGGYQIKFISLDTLIGQEWLNISKGI